MFADTPPRASVAALVLVSWMLWLATPSVAASQARRSTIVAGVADRDTGEPLPGAEVVLVDSDRAARANALGEAVLAGVPTGRAQLRVRRLGYAPAEAAVMISGDTTGVVFRLERVATTLGEVEVQADRLLPALRDVELRRQQGFGQFLDAADLAPEGDRPFAFVAAYRFPGLLLLPGKKPILASVRPELTPTGISYCPVDIYLDDQYIGVNDQDIVRTQDLAIVEYYTAARVPVKYRTRTYKCGVLLLWSKPR